MQDRKQTDMAEKLIINGEDLDVTKLYNFVRSSTLEVEIDKNSLEKMKKSHDFVMASAGKHIIYGISTGFGPMANRILAHDQLNQLQLNLIRSHAIGMGAPVEDGFVLAAMVVRLNSLVRGHSGISEELAKRYCQFINHRIIPVVPEHGSVGASGDLVQLAHIALALIGEGEVFYHGERLQSSEVIKELELGNYELKPKEGLALINGTSFMAGIAAILVAEAEVLFDYAIRSSSLALELVNGFDDSVSASLQSVRPFYGQKYIAEQIRTNLSGSKRIRSRNKFVEESQINSELYKLDEAIQEIYSLRCSPQIIGPGYDALQFVKKQVEIEINSTTDNPVVFTETQEFLHGGNFHGDYIAQAVDYLKTGLVRLGQLSERRVNFFLNHRINNRFPPFLNLETPGLTLSLQALQFVASSTVAINQSLAYPHFLHTVPTNGDNQDIVSMGTDAALISMKVLENTRTLIAIELVTLAQAVDAEGDLQNFAKSSQELYHFVRKYVEVVKADKYISDQLNNFCAALKNNF